MSQILAKLQGNKKLTRAKLLALRPALEYNDGRTKQSFADETNIIKIMARAEKVGTISHLEKFEGTYSDFSDFDFHEQSTKLAQGAQVFAELPGEIRKEFNQSPAEFFAYVNDPKNINDLAEKLPHLAQPGRQLIQISAPDADTEAAEAALNQTPPAETATPASPPITDA